MPRLGDRLMTPGVVTDLLESIANGVPLTQWSRIPGNPSLVTVHRWVTENEVHRRQYQAAREIGFDVIADRARCTARGYDEQLGGDSTKDWQRDRLIIDTDLKLLGKWAPRKYGDRVEVEHSGVVGDLGELSNRVNMLLGKALDSFSAGGPLPQAEPQESNLPPLPPEEDPW